MNHLEFRVELEDGTTIHLHGEIAPTTYMPSHPRVAALGFGLPDGVCSGVAHDQSTLTDYPFDAQVLAGIVSLPFNSITPFTWANGDSWDIYFAVFPAPLETP